MTIGKLKTLPEITFKWTNRLPTVTEFKALLIVARDCVLPGFFANELAILQQSAHIVVVEIFVVAPEG
jgi:hypothetical protein